MSDPLSVTSDIAFTKAVKAIQSRKGSRRSYARMEESGGWDNVINEDLAAFIASQTSFFLATANAQGQPYIQHRGGPAGFLKVLDDRTIGFADFRGNRQYISVGNISENPKVHLFLIDYQHQQRIKIWGEARFVEDDPELLQRLMPADYDAKAERAMIIRVMAWDANCPQHIPQRLEAADVKLAIESRDRRIRDLEGQLKAAIGRNV